MGTSLLPLVGGAILMGLPDFLRVVLKGGCYRLAELESYFTLIFIQMMKLMEQFQ